MEPFNKSVTLQLPVPVLPVRNTVLFPNASVPLLVGRQKSVEAVNAAMEKSNLLLVVSQKDGSEENPRPQALYNMGVICVVSKFTKLERGGFQFVATGLFRFRVAKYFEDLPYISADGIQMEDPPIVEPIRATSLSTELKKIAKHVLKLSAIPGNDALIKLLRQTHDPNHLCDFCCTFMNFSIDMKQKLLEMSTVDERLQTLLDLLVRESEKLSLQNEIQSKMMERLSKDQREHLLREQLKTIHEELGEEGNIQDLYHKKLEEANLSEEAKKVAKEELARLTSIPRSSPEYHVIRTYLDWLIALPWAKSSSPKPSELDLEKAREVLDQQHYGIDKVKTRILQFLAVTKLKGNHKGPILCLVGPPGVGKTSIGRSIAKALGRKFVRISLGGVRDEAEIRGHRRTYIGALPGRIVQSLKRVGVNDPLLVLDEIDKIGNDFRGDPASALLEVLDPEQNHTFVDHYIDVSFDLSKAFFITTANVTSTIPPALRDRLEMIEMTSYSKAEKLEIALKHLLPTLLEEHGIAPSQVNLPPETVSHVIEHYTREAGVRELTRKIANLLRAAAEQLAKDPAPEKVDLTPQSVETILGPIKFFPEVIDAVPKPGTIVGLAWTPVGGEILKIEVTQLEGKGSLILTGQLGEVMKESAQIALSLARSLYSDQIETKFDKTDFHIHVPAGAIPKDGPSAGVAIFLALASLLLNKVVGQNLGVTGEITLRGSVLPVGGIKEKILAAHRAGIREILLPMRNQGDLIDVSEDVRKQMTFHFLSDISEACSLLKLEAPAKRRSRPSTPPEDHPAIVV